MAKLRLQLAPLTDGFYYWRMPLSGYSPFMRMLCQRPLTVCFDYILSIGSLLIFTRKVVYEASTY